MLRLIAFIVVLAASPAAAQEYFPPRGDDGWARLDPAEAGFDPVALQAAVDFAIGNETRLDGALGEVISARQLTITTPLTWSYEPYSDPIGPLQDRGGPSGVILRGGHIVAEWGEPERVDMTFSVTKTFVSLMAGLAHMDGLIEDLHAPVAPQVADEQFHTAHNAPITWDQLLRQTSGWSGTLFGKPDWGDRPARDNAASKLIEGPPAPGERWEYNDVRVNALSLALLHVWGRPLPEVLAERIMTPIGASESWVWHGYHNSHVEIGGVRMQSVSGGGHWGGGMFISAYDMARLGLLAARGGRWDGAEIIAESWLDEAASPTAQNPGYGHMNFFLNRPQMEGAAVRAPGAPESAYAWLGAGTNVVFISAEHDLVAVVRWIDRRAMNEFLERLMAALEG